MGFLDFLNPISMLTNIGTGIASAIQGKKNYDLNEQIARDNLAMQQSNLEYQKDLQQQIFQREDTSYQRTINDMRKAGLSPLAMSGTNNSGAVLTTNAPQRMTQDATSSINGLSALGSSLNDMSQAIFQKQQNELTKRFQQKQMEILDEDKRAKELDNLEKSNTLKVRIQKQREELRRMKIDNRNQQDIYNAELELKQSESMLKNVDYQLRTEQVEQTKAQTSSILSQQKIAAEVHNWNRELHDLEVKAREGKLKEQEMNNFILDLKTKLSQSDFAYYQTTGLTPSMPDAIKLLDTLASETRYRQTDNGYYSETYEGDLKGDYARDDSYTDIKGTKNFTMRLKRTDNNKYMNYREFLLTKDGLQLLINSLNAVVPF